MNILRKIAVSACAGLLSVTLLGLAWSHVGVATIRDRDTVKGWLDKSDLYGKVGDIFLDKLKTAPDSANTIPVSDPQIQAVINDAFSPEFLKKNVETVLDASYGWLDSSTDKLAFTIDLTEAKQKLASGLGAYAKTRVEALPVCKTTPQEFDGLTADCRPSNVSGDQVAAEVSSEILNSKDFLANPVLTADDFKAKDENGKETAFENTKQAEMSRKGYRLSGYAPMMLGVLALVSALGVIFISSDRLKGIRKVGAVLLASGAILLVTIVVLSTLSNIASTKVSQTANAPAAQKELLVDIVRLIAGDIRKVLIPYTAGFLILGIAGVVGGGILKKRRDGDTKPPKDKETEEKLQDEPTEEKAVETKDEVKSDDKEESKKT